MAKKTYKTLRDIPQFTRWGSYQVHIAWAFLENMLARWKEDQEGGGYGFYLDPDFQRGHVWTEKQQIAYVEFCLQGGQSGRVIHWNHPHWQGSFEGDMVLVDGKQRIQAARRFVAGDLPAFGKKLPEYEGKFASTNPCTHFIFHVNQLPTREAVLRWYLELNTGGVVHSDEEITKVKKLLAKEKRKVKRNE